MPNNMFRDAEIQEVYYRYGVFENGGQKPKYRKAPFSILTIPATTDQRASQYLVPDQVILRGAAGGTGTMEPQWATDTWPDLPLIGWNSLRTIVLDENVMGDYQGDADTWKGVHRFEWI